MIQTTKTGINNFFRMEAVSGIILMFAATLAMALANSPLSAWYDLLIDTPVQVSVGELIVAKPLLLWINDGLMAIFFFLVGLELKRKVMEGELSQLRKIVLPGAGAIGGMFVPAAIYLTMSLFIGSLAFESTGIDTIFDERLGILIGSLLSGIFGYLLLRYNLKDGTKV